MININSIRPLGNQLLVEEIVEDKNTKGGILLPDNVRKNGEPVRARIIAYSDKLNDSAAWADLEIRKACREQSPILFHKYLGAANTKQQVGERTWLIHKDLVLAIL